MKRLQQTLVVVFLMVIVILAVFTGWREGLKGEEGSGRSTKEEIIERKLDNWVPMMP